MYLLIFWMFWIHACLVSKLNLLLSPNAIYLVPIQFKIYKKKLLCSSIVCAIPFYLRFKNCFKSHKNYQSRCSRPKLCPCQGDRKILCCSFLKCASICSQVRFACGCTEGCLNECCDWCYSCSREKLSGISCSLLVGADSRNTSTTCCCTWGNRAQLNSASSTRLKDCCRACSWQQISVGSGESCSVLSPSIRKHDFFPSVRRRCVRPELLPAEVSAGFRSCCLLDHWDWFQVLVFGSPPPSASGWDSTWRTCECFLCKQRLYCLNLVNRQLHAPDWTLFCFERQLQVFCNCIPISEINWWVISNQQQKH